MYRKSIDERLTDLGTSREGLSAEEARKRLREEGLNEIKEEEAQSVLAHFFSNFKSILVLILLAAAVISFFLAERWDAYLILAIVVINALVSTIQYARAKKALADLKELAAPHSLVIREGSPIHVRSKDVVRGDIVVVEMGDVIPADGRLIESHNLMVSESALTGESMPVSKVLDFETPHNIPLADRLNMVYASSNVTYGRGKFVATSAGMNTEIGKIAFMLLAEEEKQTPLQKRMDSLGKGLALIVVLVALGIFALGLIQNRQIYEMFFTSLALAVAAIPEGLAAIAAVILAMGVQRLSKKKTIARHLPSVETLGAASVICSDKTGTLTQNNMSVKKIATFADSNDEMLQAFALSNDVQLRADGYHIGDPTEIALINYALSQGIELEELQGELSRIADIPFDASRKLMSTFHQAEGKVVQFVKGSLEEVLARSAKILKGTQEVEITAKMRYLISEKTQSIASEGLRVLAIAKAERQSAELLTEENLTFLGLVGLVDPPRESAKESVRLCRRAGIIPVMITGDHLSTAQSIAEELGIFKAEEGHRILTGKELDQLSDEQLRNDIEKVRVFARTTPEHKLRIVRAWQDNDQVVAMTGDGVNDAPALRSADIGVAMGMNGSDVSRAAADIILVDDDFSTIVKSVEEGRGIFDNVRRTVGYLLSCNLGEILLILTALALGMPLPLLPLQILWINLISDSLPALALGVEPSEPSAMMRPPRRAGEGILTGRKIALTVFEGIVIAAIAFAAYLFGSMQSLEAGRTMSFLTLGFAQLVHAFNARSQGSIFNRNLFANMSFFVSVIISGVLLALVALLPLLQSVFRIVAIDVSQWLFVAGLSTIPLVLSEIRKIFIQG